MDQAGLLYRSDWSSRPLCTKYSTVVLVSQDVPLSSSEGLTCQTHWWALGSVANGEHEILGHWVPPLGDENPSSAIASDLIARGVESVRAALVSHGAGVPARLPGFLSPGVLLTSLDAAGAYVLPARLRLSMSRAVAIAGGLQASLSRVIRRRRSFSSAAAAATFFDSKLERFDGRLWSC